MRAIPIDQFSQEHFPQVHLLEETVRPKNYIVINHNSDNQHTYSTEEIAGFAKNNSASFEKDGVEYFALVFGHPGVKPVILQKHEISKALLESSYGQCPNNKLECPRKDLCPVC